MRHSLEQIRRDLRGPIAQSPFAGRRKQLKLDYCDRQIKFYRGQYEHSGIGIFSAQVVKWKSIKRHVESGKL